MHLSSAYLVHIECILCRYVEYSTYGPNLLVGIHIGSHETEVPVREENTSILPTSSVATKKDYELRRERKPNNGKILERATSHDGNGGGGGFALVNTPSGIPRI